MISFLAAAISAIIVSVHDGDTITVRIGAVTEIVRLLDIDAPELPPRAHCPSEAAGALAARDALRRLAPPGLAVTLQQTGRLRDRYGRLLALVILSDGRGAGNALMQAGLARAWTGKRHGWCPDLASPKP